MIRLLIRERGAKGQLRSFTTETLVIGRGESCDLRLQEPEASARHCRITRENDGYSVEDLDSKNGTWLNERRIRKRVPWPPGEELRIGKTTLRQPMPTEPAALRPPPAKKTATKRLLAGGALVAIAIAGAVALSFGEWDREDPPSSAATVPEPVDLGPSLDRQIEALDLLAARARTLLPGIPDVAALLLVEGLRESHPPGGPTLSPQLRASRLQAVRILRTALSSLESRALTGLTDRPHGLAVSRSGRTVAASDDAGALVLWDLDAPHPAPLQTIAGQGEKILGLAFAENDRYLVAAAADGIARRFDLHDTALPPRSVVLGDHAAPLCCADVASEGGWLATADTAGTLRIWDAIAEDPSAGSSRIDLGEAITAVRLAPDASYLVATTTKGTTWMTALHQGRPSGKPVKLHREAGAAILSTSNDGRTWLVGHAGGDVDLLRRSLRGSVEKPQALRGHRGPILALAVTPDASLGFASAEDGAVIGWRLGQARPTETGVILKGHEGPVRAMVVDPLGDLLYTASDDATLRAYDLSNLDLARSRVLRGHVGPVRAMVFSPRTQTIVTAGDDRSVRTWNGRTAGGGSTLTRAHEGAVLALARSREHGFLVTAGSDHVIRAWRFGRQGRLDEAAALAGHTAPVHTVAISPNGSLIATGGEDRVLRVWQRSANGAFSEWAALRGHTDQINKVEFTHDGKYVVSISSDKTVRVWSAENPGILPKVLSDHTDEVHGLAVGTRSRLIVTSSLDETIRLWDLSQERPGNGPRVLTGHDGPVWVVAMSPDGRWIASGSEDQKARLWDLNSHARPTVLRGHQGSVDAIAFDQSKRIATGSADGTIRVYDLLSAHPDEHPIVLERHQGGVTNLAFESDGTHLISAGNDGTVRIWDLSTAAPSESSVSLPGHTGRIFGLFVDNDQDLIVTAGQDGTVRAWPLSDQAVARFACRVLGRSLTPDEWRAHLTTPYRETCPAPVADVVAKEQPPQSLKG